MKLLIAVILFFSCPKSPQENQLEKLLEQEKINKKEYTFFIKQLAFKELINTAERIDSMPDWKLDIVYTNEKYLAKKDSFIVCEYYFNSSRFDSIDQSNSIYRPDRYYENGVLKRKYFFHHNDAKDHLKSILKHMKNRNLVDTINPLAKVEVMHPGCGMSYYQVERERKKANRKYRKPKTPKYFLTETLQYKNEKKISFQLPVKRKFNVIVEGYSF